MIYDINYYGPDGLYLELEIETEDSDKVDEIADHAIADYRREHNISLPA